MNRAIDQRVRRLESGRGEGGPRVLLSAFPLPEDPNERDAVVDDLLDSGEAVLRSGYLLAAREMPADEWAAWAQANEHERRGR
jgi:hypothetical protein